MSDAEKELERGTARADSEPIASDDQNFGAQSSSIRSEIGETRNRMSSTLTEIGERLNPYAVKEQVTQKVKDGLRDATIGRVEDMAQNTARNVQEAKNTMIQTVRDNPIPAAMVAVGLGWLLYNGQNDEDGSGRNGGQNRSYPARGGYSRQPTNSYPASYAQRSYPGSYQGGHEDRHEGGQGLTDSAKKIGEQISDSAENAGRRVKEGASALLDSAENISSSFASSVSTHSHEAAEMVSNQTRRGARKVEDAFHSNPIGIGAVALALGVMAGMAVPVTDREVQVMGDAGEKIVDRVSDVAHETKDKVEHVAEKAIDETKRLAKEEGLTKS